MAGFVGIRNRRPESASVAGQSGGLHDRANLRIERERFAETKEIVCRVVKPDEAARDEGLLERL